MFTFLPEPPTEVQLLLCAGKCVERLPVRMLLLHSILASDLQGAEKKSSIPRHLLIVFLPHSQIHCSDLPAGGALGLDTSRTSSLPGGNQCRGRFNQTSCVLQPLTDDLIMSPKDRSQVCSKVEQNLF